jgi:hypothetical protein
VTTLLTVEDQLLLSAAHPILSAERQQRITRLLAREPDWPRLAAGAERHGLGSILHGHLRWLDAGGVPPAIRESLARSARACVAWNLRLRHALDGLLGAFARAAIDVMPLKGPVLADRLYPDPLLRSTGDLDVLVRRADDAAAEALLEALGYRRLPEPEQGATYHTRFASGEADAAGDVVVEVHRELGESHVSRPDVEAVWASASRTVWAGQPIWSMALPDLVLYLCFHATKDGLASLRALLDVALLVDRHGEELAWDALATRVKSAHLASPVYLALSQSRALLDAPVPAAVLDDLRPRGLGWRLGQRVLGWRGGVLHAPDELLVGPVMAVLMMLWEDAPRGRRRHLRRNLLPSASVRARWTGAGPAAAWLGWYPILLREAARQARRRLRARGRDIPCC